MTALNRLSKHAPTGAFHDREEDITTFLIRQLKRVSEARQTGTDSSFDQENEMGTSIDYVDWCADEDFLHEHQACIIGLKILTNRCLACIHQHNADKMTSRTVKIMTTILSGAGIPETFRKG